MVPIQKTFYEAILKHIIIDNRSFFIIEGKGFLTLMKETAPLHKVPNRETIK